MTMEDSGACDSRVLGTEPDELGSDGQGAWREVKSRSVSISTGYLRPRYVLLAGCNMTMP